jgi:hypothetical protein
MLCESNSCQKTLQRAASLPLKIYLLTLSFSWYSEIFWRIVWLSPNKRPGSNNTTAGSDPTDPDRKTGRLSRKTAVTRFHPRIYGKTDLRENGRICGKTDGFDG